MSGKQPIENAIYALVAEYAFTSEDRTEKHIAQTTLAHLSEIDTMTVEKMAELCGVSESTFLRFCRKIGYSSFTDFKVRLSNTLQKYLFINTPFSTKDQHSEDNFFTNTKAILNADIDRLEQLLDTDVCKEIVHQFSKAKKVYIFDIFYSTVRFALHGDLAVTGKDVVFLRPSSDIGKILKNDKSGTSMAFMVYDGQSRTKDILSAIAICRQNKIPSAVMSCALPFINQELCDYVLFTGKAESAISSVVVHDLVFQYLSMLYAFFISSSSTQRLLPCKRLSQLSKQVNESATASISSTWFLP